MTINDIHIDFALDSTASDNIESRNWHRMNFRFLHLQQILIRKINAIYSLPNKDSPHKDDDAGC